MNASSDTGSDSPTGLVLTGERTLPGIAEENYWFQRHVVAYDLVRAAASGATVLDAGCGEGYGLAMLEAAGATRVVGVDLDATVVEHVVRTYGSAVVEAHAAELMSLPLDDDEVDLTVSFQVIEHLYDIPGYLRSLRRVTRPGGEVVIATPNRLTFTPDSDVPVNPFHTREFTAAELHDEMAGAGLEPGTVLGVHHGPRIVAVEAEQGRPLVDLITATAPDAWPDWLRELVVSVTPADFVVRADGLDASLDLIARAPRTA